LEHPGSRGQTNWHFRHGTQGAHHVAIRNRVWCRHVDGAAERFMRDQPSNRPAKITFVNPRHILPAATHPATQAKACELMENAKHSAFLGAENHARSESDFPGLRCMGLEESFFPSP